MSDISSNKAVVTRFFEIFSRGDVPGLLDAMADGSSWLVQGKLEGMSGRYDKASFGPLLEGVKAMYRGGALAITPTSMIAEGDQVAVEALGHAELMDGRIYCPQYHFLVTLRGDKVFEVREYMDTQHAKEIFFGG